MLLLYVSREHLYRRRGSPAEGVGIVPGDILIEIDGQQVNDLDIDEVHALLHAGACVSC